MPTDDLGSSSGRHTGMTPAEGMGGGRWPSRAESMQTCSEGIAPSLTTRQFLLINPYGCSYLQPHEEPHA